MKFRVYDKKEKKYPENQHHFYIDSDGDLFFDKNKMEISSDLTTCEPDRYIVEYSTGLKDKNGVEIFVGDIIRSFSSEGEDVRHAIGYNKDDARFTATVLPITKWTYGECGLRKDWIEEFKKEIIGNIHDGEENGDD